jgi:Protein of unknown function (DUF1186)
MTPDRILSELRITDILPVNALLASTAQRDEMTPLFLDEIENFIAAPEGGKPLPSALFYIFHLMGQWRETASYRPLARLLRSPPGDIDLLFGDWITEGAHRVMAAVFDGDPQPLIDIILDSRADPFVRSRMCETLAMAVLDGRLSKDRALNFLREAFDLIYPLEHNFTWYGWQSAIAMLGFEELVPLVEEAFERGMIENDILGFADFEDDLSKAMRHPGAPRGKDPREFTLCGDVIEEMTIWYDVFRRESGNE